MGDSVRNPIPLPFRVAPSARGTDNSHLPGHFWRDGAVADEDVVGSFLEPNYEVLHNPVTVDYLNIKKAILGNSIEWQYDHSTAGVQTLPPYAAVLPMLSHVVLDRYDWGDNGYPERKRVDNSRYYDHIKFVLEEICHANGFHPEFYRIALNFTQFSRSQGCPIHRDHEFPHYQMLVYLTDFMGGWTWINGQRCPDPKEDGVICFDGLQLHHHEPPYAPGDRRVVLVSTFKPVEIPNG